MPATCAGYCRNMPIITIRTAPTYRWARIRLRIGRSKVLARSNHARFWVGYTIVITGTARNEVFGRDRSACAGTAMRRKVPLRFHLNQPQGKPKLTRLTLKGPLGVHFVNLRERLCGGCYGTALAAVGRLTISVAGWQGKSYFARLLCALIGDKVRRHRIPSLRFTRTISLQAILMIFKQLDIFDWLAIKHSSFGFFIRQFEIFFRFMKMTKFKIHFT
jgi:hypothetical protein